MLKYRGALLGGILLISTYPVLVKYIGELASISAFYRVFFSTIILLPILFFKKGLQLPDKKDTLKALLCGIFFGLDIYFWNLAIEGSSATQATLLTNLAPIFVGLITFLFLPNKPKTNFWIGALIAFIGMIVFIGWQVFYSFSFDLPFLYGILSALLYASYIVLSKSVLQRVDVLPYMTLNSLSATLFLAVLNISNQNAFTGFSTQEWILLFIGGLFCQLIAWLLISYATKYMRATRVSLSLLSQTVFAALLAYFLLDEVITLNMILGGIIILIGIGVTFKE